MTTLIGAPGVARLSIEIRAASIQPELGQSLRATSAGPTRRCSTPATVPPAALWEGERDYGQTHAAARELLTAVPRPAGLSWHSRQITAQTAYVSMLRRLRRQAIVEGSKYRSYISARVLI